VQLYDYIKTSVVPVMIKAGLAAMSLSYNASFAPSSSFCYILKGIMPSSVALADEKQID
jgi:hypothetical protein